MPSDKMKSETKEDLANKHSKAMARSRTTISDYAGQVVDAHELLGELTGLDLAEVTVTDARISARRARAGASVVHGAGAAAGGLAHGLGTWGIVGALVVGVGGTIAEMFGLGDGRGAGRRVVNASAGVAAGLIGAVASKKTQELRASRGESQEL